MINYCFESRDCTQGAEIRRVRESLDLESAGKNGDRHFLWPGRHGDSEICIYKVNPGKNAECRGDALCGILFECKQRKGIHLILTEMISGRLQES